MFFVYVLSLIVNFLLLKHHVVICLQCRYGACSALYRRITVFQVLNITQHKFWAFIYLVSWNTVVKI